MAVRQMMYRCCTCKIEKPEEDFTPSRRREKLPQCRECRNTWRNNRTRGLKVGRRRLGAGDISRLAGHLSDPVVKDVVLAYVRQRGCAVLLCDLYGPLRLPRMTVQRVLVREVKAGRAQRWKVPV